MSVVGFFIDGHPLRLMLLSKGKQNLLKIDPALNTLMSFVQVFH
jgi:hypothetical protein